MNGVALHTDNLPRTDTLNKYLLQYSEYIFCFGWSFRVENKVTLSAPKSRTNQNRNWMDVLFVRDWLVCANAMGHVIAAVLDLLALYSHHLQAFNLQGCTLARNVHVPAIRPPELHLLLLPHGDAVPVIF